MPIQVVALPSTYTPTGVHGSLYTNNNNGSLRTSIVGGSNLEVNVTGTSSIIQNVISSRLNSSTGNLPSGGWFTGIGESSLGVNAAQINLKTDQNCVVYFDQSTDNNNWDITDNFNYYYSLGGNSWTTQMTASYFRVRVNNLNLVSGTSYFRLQTALCPIVEALPRALSPNGYLKTNVEEISGPFGANAVVSPMGALHTTEATRLIGATFNNILDPNFWTGTYISGANASVAGCQLTLSTVSGNGSGFISSIRTARYVSANSNYFRGVVRTPTVVGSNIRRWGAFTTDDGFFYEYDGVNLGCVCRKGRADTKVSNGAFNGTNGAFYNLDANIHTYEIHWTNSSTWFFIDSVLIHKFRGSTAPLSNSTNLKLGFENNNLNGNSNNNTLEVRVASVNRLGKEETLPQWNNIKAAGTYVLKYGPGSLHNVMINSAGAAGNTLIIADNIMSGVPTIATLDLNKTTASPGNYAYNLPFFSGLTVIANSTADCTIVYE